MDERDRMIWAWIEYYATARHGTDHRLTIGAEQVWSSADQEAAIPYRGLIQSSAGSDNLRRLVPRDSKQVISEIE